MAHCPDPPGEPPDLTTDLCHGGLGLCQVWWSYITRWITLGQQELQNNGPTQHLTTTQYKYIEAVRALGGTWASVSPSLESTAPLPRACSTQRALRRTRKFYCLRQCTSKRGWQSANQSLSQASSQSNINTQFGFFVSGRRGPKQQGNQ